MHHHKHPGLVGRLVAAGSRELTPHPDAARADAQMTWFAITTADGREVEALEGLLCIPTRDGAMRLAAIPHVVEGLALGDEVAVGEWDGAPIARGELALGLTATVRCVAASERGWLWLARLLDEAAGGAGSCWFDVIDAEALAASVPRSTLAAVFAALTAAAERGELRWEYVTADRHAS